MAAMKLKCYGVNATQIMKMTYDKFANFQFLPASITGLKDKYKEGWLKIKEKMLEKSNPETKSYKGIKYMPLKTTNPNTVLIFALGDDAENLLKEIYLQEMNGKAPAPQKEVIKPEIKAQSKEVDSAQIDLADSKIAFEQKYNALMNKAKCINKLSEEDTYHFLHNMIGNQVIDSYKKDKGYQEEFFKQFALKLKANKNILDTYCDINSVQIANLLKEANKESKSNANFYNDVMSI